MLTSLLVPLLRDSAPARVVNVASAAKKSPIDFRDPMPRRGYDGMRTYSRSKLAQVTSPSPWPSDSSVSG